jgi:hypothetical protein
MFPIFLAVSILAAPVPAKPEEKNIEYVVHTGHFERNDSGLKGDASQLVFTDADAMAKIFGTVPPLGGKKQSPVTKDVFGNNLVVAAITRGSSVGTYSDVTTRLSGTTLTVTYKVRLGADSTANFATPLILSVPKDGIKSVVFVVNGKETAKIEVK